jgi:hypothetical protein
MQRVANFMSAIGGTIGRAHPLHDPWAWIKYCAVSAWILSIQLRDMKTMSRISIFIDPD